MKNLLTHRQYLSQVSNFKSVSMKVWTKTGMLEPFIVILYCL